MRRKIIAGNWKMNMAGDEARMLAQGIRDRVQSVRHVEVLVCPAFPFLQEVGNVLRGSQVRLGAQNMHWEPQGAFTGEVSSRMLLTAGCQYVILGHSERRLYGGETDEQIRKKVAAALAAGLIPILCLGETLEERESGQTQRVVGGQLESAVQGVSREEMSPLIIAYEPVWAIGTGRSATPEMANEVHAFLRERAAGLWGTDAAEKIRIQYGGSVTETNAFGLFSQPDIDGALIGGASLKPDLFSTIVLMGAQHTGG